MQAKGLDFAKTFVNHVIDAKLSRIITLSPGKDFLKNSAVENWRVEKLFEQNDFRNARQNHAYHGALSAR